MQELIGITAGRIWQYLNDYGEVSRIELKFTLDISNTLLHLALGWLAREEKIIIRNEGKECLITLRQG